MHNTNDTITIDTLLAMVEAKFRGSYVASATLMGWDVATETAEVKLDFSVNGVHAPDQTITMFAQAVFCGGAMGAATAVSPYKAKQGPRYYVPVTAR